MNPDDVVILDWSFSPPDYFEEESNITNTQYRMEINRGNIEARISPECYANKPNLRDNLHELIQARFNAVQVLTHKPYTLSKSRMKRVHPDGRQDYTLFAEGISSVAIIGGEVDFVVKDRLGNIIRDSKKDRIATKNELANLAQKHAINDSTAAGILDSYSKAVADPGNELVHLYEIRDALSNKFGGETVTLKALNMSHTRWSRLGDLANTQPIKQGRHRGKNAGALRDATKEELLEARSIAREMVEGYLKYLG